MKSAKILGGDNSARHYALILRGINKQAACDLSLALFAQAGDAWRNHEDCARWRPANKRLIFPSLIADQTFRIVVAITLFASIMMES